MANNGAWIENKKQSLTFHYRQVPDHLQETYQQTATKMIESYGLLANQAHCAIEAKPPVRWNKGIIKGFESHNITSLLTFDSLTAMLFNRRGSTFDFTRRIR